MNVDFSIDSRKYVKPIIIQPEAIINTIPEELIEINQWVTWKEKREGQRVKKKPYNPLTHRSASVTNPSDWASFNQAIQATLEHGYNGVGFVVTSNDPYVGVDLDDCVSDGRISKEAGHVIETLNSYTEFSPSGTGIRIWVKGALPEAGRRTDSIEIYADKHYLTVTGQHLVGTPAVVEYRPQELLYLYEKYFPEKPTTLWVPTSARSGELSDDRILSLARKARNAEKFNRLWNGDIEGYTSASEADLALIQLIAFFTQDADQIERLFSQSTLGERDKWLNRPDYRERTIDKALATLTATYSGYGGRSDRSSWLIGYDSDEWLIKELKEITGCTLRLIMDEAGLYKYECDDVLYTPAQVYASYKADKPLENFKAIPPPTHACWKLRLLVEAGFVEKPEINLAPLPADALGHAEVAYQGFKLLIECKQIYQNTDRVEPSSYSIRLALEWCGTSFQRAREGINWLKENGYLVEVGKDPKGIPLYLPGLGLETCKIAPKYPLISNSLLSL